MAKKTKPKRKPTSKTMLTETKARLKGLKQQVRNKVAKGHALSAQSKTNELESRDIQIKIASLETAAERAETRTPSANTEQKMRKQMDALKRRLKP